MTEYFFPSHWTACACIEWTHNNLYIIHNYHHITEKDLTLVRGWDGKQFWFTFSLQIAL